MCLANPSSNFEVRGEALNPKTTHTHTLSLLQNTHMCKATRIPRDAAYTCRSCANARMNEEVLNITKEFWPRSRSRSQVVSPFLVFFQLYIIIFFNQFTDLCTRQYRFGLRLHDMEEIVASETPPVENHLSREAFPLLPLIFQDTVCDNKDTNTDFVLINIFNHHAGRDLGPTTRLYSPSVVVRLLRWLKCRRLPRP